MRQEIDYINKELKELKEIVDKLNDTVGKIKGSPIIQGYTGKRLDLNENINAVILLRRIKDLEEKVEALS